ncbi:MAG: hypothetical protein NTX25_09455 [Proteobacteria bacterium]|nr:hypothetical protein [Pseudomonadota bacterium]
MELLTYPHILASDRSFFWTLQPNLDLDYFSFRTEGAGALLLLGMHLVEKRPWECARNPVYFSEQPGYIDIEAKKILGKRFKQAESSPLESTSKPIRALDPWLEILASIDKAEHCFFIQPRWPDLTNKQAGKLLPRKLWAKAEVSFEGGKYCLYSRNFSELSQCLHAELVLLFGLSRLLSQEQKRPDRIISLVLEASLKPCKMCAAFLDLVRQKCLSFEVKYAEDDPGPLAANTRLDRFSYRS